MKKMLMIDNECLLKLADCFSDTEEMQTFLQQIEATTKELIFLGMLRDRVEEDAGPAVLMQQVAVLTLFCREHIELIQQLIQNLETREMTEEERQEMVDGDELD